MSASVARREAISPACAPPMPSATANSGGRSTNESSLCRRLRPVWVNPVNGPRITCPVPEVCFADSHDIARRRAVAAPRSGRRSRRFRSSIRRPRARRHRDAASKRACAAEAKPSPRRSMSFGSAPPDRERRRVEHEVRAGGERGALDHDEPPRLVVRRPEAEGLRPVGREHEALARRDDLLARAPDDPPDEEVEQHEERDLEHEQRLVDLDRVRDRAMSHASRESELGRPERDAVAVLELRALRAGGR